MARGSRGARRIVLLFVLSLALAPCWAGGYSVSYSGGSCATVNDGFPSNTPYDSDSSSTHGSGIAWWGDKPLSDGTRVATSGSAVCSGGITATFMWQSSGPGDDPPEAVVVAETSTASWNGAGNVPPSGNCDNGLGFPEVPDPPSQPGNPYIHAGGSSTGVRYQIKQNPGPSFSIPACSPSASVSRTGAAGPPTYGGMGQVSVNYSASTSPVEITLGGGLSLPINKLFLIGQKAVGTVSTGGLSASSYQWDVDGGDPFKNWVGRQNNTTFLPLGVETNSSLTFRFKTPAKVATVTCAMHLETPQGTLPAGGLDVTTEKPCRVLRPDVASFSAYTPQNPGSFGLSGYPTDGVGLYDPPDYYTLAFRGLATPNYSSGVTGICWEGEIQTSTLSPNPWDGDGGWHFVQKVQGNRYQVNNGVSQSSVQNGLDLLDNTYPYEPGPFDPEDGWPGTYVADGANNYAGDGPAMALDVPGGSGVAITEVEANEHFDTWMMYRPPGEGSAFVPIKKIKWSWHGKAKVIGGVWTLLIHDSGWQFDGDYPLFPEWTGFASLTGISTWVP